ncbi:hypothetical protein PDE_01047 [Penicillium oxalicum 114-2]|uniref:Uncharacterized protein n=1 Tax=Penicillium oxalicum (strain 114-2 / CGMCC 5302) TaxID=933388 RepID=S7ZBP5_PENO1|nr:hypothetical protein PDE_01047 [Penicillium oxalicum 114-2]
MDPAELFGTGNLPDSEPSLPEIKQDASPLFTVLPAEVRNRIYTFSLEYSGVLPWSDTKASGASYDGDQSTSTSAPYRGNAFYFRPGYNQPKRILTSLLQTCQAIYNEASLLPPAVSEHTFWFYRGPPHVKDASSPLRYFAKMTPKQRAQVQHLHFFTQQFFLEDKIWSTVWNGIEIVRRDKDKAQEAGAADGSGYESKTTTSPTSPSPPTSSSSSPQFSTSDLSFSIAVPKARRTETIKISPRTLTITLRHTDWWFWENDQPLGIDPFRVGRTIFSRPPSPPAEMSPDSRPSFPMKRPWGEQFVTMPSLEELTIEFETVMRKRDQLDDIIQRALHWRFPLRHRPWKSEMIYLVPEPRSVQAYTWVGATESELKCQGTKRSALVPQFARVNHSPKMGEGTSVAAWEDRTVPERPVLRPYTIGDGPRSGLPEGTEEYYVVFVTWKCQAEDEEAATPAGET